MTRRRKILTIAAASVAGLILLILIVAVAVMQTDWFRNYVRQKIIAVTEESTGGRVELSRFDFNLWGLRATMEGFVLHGTEPPEAKPLFSTEKLEVQLRLFSGLKKVIDLRSITVEQPQANIIVYPDGRTNVPEPKVKKESDKSALETIVDLAIGKFDLRNGTIQFADKKLPLHARGENLRAHLDYNTATQRYQGEIAMNPLFVTYDGNTPANISVTLPVTLERDRIGFDKARIATAESEILVSGAVENLVSPRLQVHANANIALAEVERVSGLDISNQAGDNLPGKLMVDAAAMLDGDRIQVDTARASLGDSSIEASGTLKDPSGPGGLDFRGKLALGELGRLFQVAAQPTGVVNLNGKAKLIGESGYQVNGNVQGTDLSFLSGDQRFSNIHIASAIDANQNRIELEGLRLDAFGGNLSGNAAIEEMARFELDARLRNFDIERLSHALANKSFGYSGTISGPIQAQANLKAPGTSGIRADTQLSITPGGTGVPVSGRLNARYNGGTDTITIADSLITLPNTRVTMSGDLGEKIDLHFRSTNLNDFLPAMRATSTEPVKSLPLELRNGAATLDATIRGTLKAPQIAGQLAMTNFAVEGRQFDRLSANLSASPSGASLRNTTITRGNMSIHAAADIGLRDWKPEPEQKLTLTTTIRDGNVPDLLALAGQSDTPVTGTVTADVKLGGTVGNPVGTAHAVVTDGVAYDQPFDKVEANVGFTNQRIELSSASVLMDAGNLQLTGTFDHPADSYDQGTVRAHLTTNQIQLGMLRPAVKRIPGLAGTLEADARIAGDLSKQNEQTQFLLTSVNADMNVRGLKAEDQDYGELTATARTSGSTVDYRVNSNFAGSALRVDGETALKPEYPTTAKADLSGLPVERVLAFAGARDIQVRGVLSGAAQFSGTVDDPNASVDLTLADAVVYNEPVERLELRSTYTNQLIDVPRLEIATEGGRLEATARYTYKPGDLQNGQVTFSAKSTELQLDRYAVVRRIRPGFSGTLRLIADGAATVQNQPGGTQLLPTSLNANVAATNLGLNGNNLGDLRLTAKTAGDRLTFDLASNLAGSTIKGSGQATLTGDYPVDARMEFANLTYSGVRPLIREETLSDPLVEVLLEGQAEVRGPVMKPEQMTGRFALPRLEVSSTSRPGSPTQLVTLRNDGPIVFVLNGSVLKVERARVVGPQTEILLAGTAALNTTQPMDLDVKANTNLGLLQQMSRSIYSSGAIVLAATVRGRLPKPSVNGRLELKEASINHIDAPNGISNANGVIVFNGTSATIESLTGESGGGKLTASGFVSYGGRAVSYGLEASANGVRVRQPPGASIVVSADVNLRGTTRRSLLSGTVTLERIGFSPKSDFGSMLARSSQPAEVPTAPTGALAGMRLDIAVRTAPGASFETSLAQNVQANVDLRVRGTAGNPGVLGQVNVTQGEMVFFGTKYTVNRGNIAFYDPTRIRPVLNIDLQTVTKGVNVTLNVAGPVDNMKLTHRSDPPLQFNEIIALLATGRTPTTDPNLVANEPVVPPQSLQQMGQSALVSQAVANPVANRLERVFGVSDLKIDPTFASGSELPQARLTLQQQITSNVTFTYITNLNQANSQIIRLEWALNEQWAAVATREETGRFGVDFFYKKTFR